MANIQKLTYPYFTDGTTQLNAANLNPIIDRINSLIDVVNASVTISSSDSGLLDVADANGNVIMRLNHSLEVTSDKSLKIGGVTK
jgi:hypothetical protein